jgi:putrescine transport system substrate-binding protein
MIRALMICILLTLTTFRANGEEVVHVYGWYHHIPDEVFKQFEKETGIKVKFDLIDSNEVLQAKLLVGNSGYDVVFPTSYPYLALQVPAKLYHQIDPAKLSNYHHIDPEFLNKLQLADPGNKYAVPFAWGLVVIGYNEEILKSHVCDKYLDSWALLYDPGVVSKLSRCGVALLEDASDVYYSSYLYQDINFHDASYKTLKEVTEQLKAIRPYIKKFDISLSSEQLASGEICVAQQWVNNLVRAQKEYANLKNRPKIKIVFPKEGSVMWIDSVAIPSDAPHIDNAYKFIDFLLRPDISAKITNHYFLRTAIKENEITPFIEPEIRKNPYVFPDATILKKAKVAHMPSLQFFRQMTRSFLNVLSVH